MRWGRLILVFLLLLLLGAKSGPEVFFEMADPAGDDFGPGGYQYPRNIAFEPYHGLFDILNFKVWQENPREVNFDVKMAKVTNPWAAPEGFIHPVIQIYIHARPGGQIIPATHGPDIRFSPEYGWQYCLIGAGWGNSKIVTFDESNEPIVERLTARLLEDRSTIRLTVPTTMIGEPEQDWQYYVLVGSYDGFGPGFFRDVRHEDGEWTFGGGIDARGEPRVLDLLAPEKGRYSQENQLRYDPTQGPVILYPVGYGITEGFRWWPQLGWLLLIILIVGGIVLAWRKNRIFIFWHSVKEEPVIEEKANSVLEVKSPKLKGKK